MKKKSSYKVNPALNEAVSDLQNFGIKPAIVQRYIYSISNTQFMAPHFPIFQIKWISKK